VQVCPVECIPINPAHRETREQLMDKYRALQAQAAPSQPAEAAGEDQLKPAA
jgi:hypothetical protein